MTFWWWSFPLSEGLQPCENLRTSWSGGIRMLPYILTLRNTTVLKKRGSWSAVPSHSQKDELCASSMFRGVSATFRWVKGACLYSFGVLFLLLLKLILMKTSLVEIVFVIGLFYMENGRSIFSPLENNGVSRGRNAGEHSDSTRPTGAKVFTRP